MTDNELLAPKWSPCDVFSKMDWEGGICSVLEWGLTADKIEPGKLQEAWSKLDKAWEAFKEARSEVDKLLPEWEQCTDDDH